MNVTSPWLMARIPSLFSLTSFSNFSSFSRLFVAKGQEPGSPWKFNVGHTGSSTNTGLLSLYISVIIYRGNWRYTSENLALNDIPLKGLELQIRTFQMFDLDIFACTLLMRVSQLFQMIRVLDRCVDFVKPSLKFVDCPNRNSPILSVIKWIHWTLLWLYESTLQHCLHPRFLRNNAQSMEYKIRSMANWKQNWNFTLTLTDLWVVWPLKLVVLDKGYSGLKNGVEEVGMGVGVSKLLSEGGPPLPPLAQPHLCFSKFT